MSLAVAVGALAAAVVGCAVAPSRPSRRPVRPVALRPPATPPMALARWGARFRAVARIPASPLPDAGLGVVAALLVALFAWAPPLALLAGLGVWAHARIRARRAHRARSRQIIEALPDGVDLLLLCVGAGLSLPLALPLVASRSASPLAGALASAHRAAARGSPRADALLDALHPLGDRALALGHVLVDHLRYGTPLAAGLERLGSELRSDRRRRAEEAARRVPVRLLVPLVTCVLPAFALLTVVPLLAASLRSLPT